jgi:hypothetical protein
MANCGKKTTNTNSAIVGDRGDTRELQSMTPRGLTGPTRIWPTRQPPGAVKYESWTLVDLGVRARGRNSVMRLQPRNQVITRPVKFHSKNAHSRGSHQEGTLVTASPWRPPDVYVARRFSRRFRSRAKNRIIFFLVRVTAEISQQETRVELEQLINRAHK